MMRREKRFIIKMRIISVIGIIAGGIILSLGTNWYIGIGLSMITWALLPTLRG